ncbi:MAG TPA: cytochrome c3 family protein [Armatimonadota bacterium]|nr:cytochrome c3 family protein [Armatimonadota bacterium]HOP80371.1 cytochrome c3 family protein [Armatimonadota bacterium]HPP76166.1 cytochrome c3 family protein [Armatimonadota bacterium]
MIFARVPSFPKPIKLAVAVLAIILLLAVGALVVRAKLDIGPAQPIPFSHRVHADTKQINCFFCHQYAAVSSNPGIPTVDKCVLCHEVIASQFPPIANVLGYYNRQESIPWVKVNNLAGFVRFSHQAHLTRRIDCSRCHGNIKAMDRVEQVHRFNMNFCITCHWDKKASVDCYTCHY